MSGKTVRLAAAQAVMRDWGVQARGIDGRVVPLFDGFFANFEHHKCLADSVDGV